MNGSTGWNILKGQRIARLDIGIWSRGNLVADLQPQRGDDVALLTIQVMQQRDTSRTIWIVLDGRDPGGHVQLIALKIDNTISSLGTTAAIASGDLTLVIAASMPLQLDCQRFLWLCLCYLLECRN